MQLDRGNARSDAKESLLRNLARKDESQARQLAISLSGTRRSVLAVHSRSQMVMFNIRFWTVDISPRGFLPLPSSKSTV